MAALSEIPAEADERLTPIIEECWSRLDEAQHDAIIDIPTRIDTNGEIHDLVLTLFTTAGAFDVLHLDPASVGLHVLDGELHYVPSDDG